MALAMDHRYMIPRPSGGTMTAVFVSAATTASRMLTRCSWSPVELLRFVMMVGIWFHVWGLRLLMDFLSPNTFSSSSSCGLLAATDFHSSSSALVAYSSSSANAAATAIGRSLSHMLGILNEIPAASRKYEYVLAMADGILSENVELGHAALLAVNRAVLSSAFSRTADRLLHALQRSESAASLTGWPARVLDLLPPPLGPRLASCYTALCLCLSVALPTAGDAWRTSLASKFTTHLPSPAPGSSSAGWMEAEKLANELLWITNKLRDCWAVDEAIQQWSAATALASMALTAHPRVQATMVRITAVLYGEMGREAGGGVRFGMVALWLPLLCYAGNGVGAPVLVGKERREVERVVEEMVEGMTMEEQEVVLRNWIDDFAASGSDWPNLHRSFHRWCHLSRNLII